MSIGYIQPFIPRQVVQILIEYATGCRFVLKLYIQAYLYRLL